MSGWYTPAYLVLFLVFSHFIRSFKRTSLPLPPGPPRLPIVGNLFNRPSGERFHLQYMDLIATYGPIMSLKVFGRTTIVMNDFKTANELLEKRSANYSDRPSYRMLSDILQWWWNIAVFRYSDSWRSHRKTFSDFFNHKVVKEYTPIQDAASYALMRALLQTPEDFFNLVRRHAGSSILEVVYGLKGSAYDDYIEVADKSIVTIDLAFNPGHFFIDYLPILKYAPPWVAFKRRGRQSAEYALEMREQPVALVQRSLTDGSAVPCIVSKLLESQPPDRLNLIKNMSTTAFVAGADTTVSQNLTTIMALLHCPEVQKKAHEEVDRVIGRHRAPTCADRTDLKYIEAINLEALRWRPVLPLGLGHASVSDDVYGGYFIPGDCDVIANAWAILHDPLVYKDPEEFNPERFMGANHEPYPGAAFGWGRRVCPGRYFSSNSAFSLVASLIWAYDILPAGDGSLPDSMAYTNRSVIHPCPFKCRFEPRFDFETILTENAL
ncbi:cytochrome P450 [Cylindrobasidium torrendii FP15055 ss-10]|uniref:Cytochrome P450 n=1 Tax=Cylindrobasidium torrendii FP15055 ss-10 TaxID=1314674 RepID=A0A0D7BLU8_9AGAR|nr:cytochrome P450 [Cylindrobasidium torrendii FP15055 ss-10]